MKQRRVRAEREVLTLRYSSLNLSFSASIVDTSSRSDTFPALLRSPIFSRQILPSSKAFERSTWGHFFQCPSDRDITLVPVGYDIPRNCESRNYLRLQLAAPS